MNDSRFRLRLAAGAVLGIFLVTVPLSLAQQPAAGARAIEAQANSAAKLRRDWVLKQLPQLITDQRMLTEVRDRVAVASDEEINELANVCLAELELRRRRQFQNLRELNARERAFQQELARAATRAPAFGAASPVGYFPIIGWFPDGVSMSASAVVSPDRRSVRMSLMPFFSTIGPVYTFNYRTGETRRLPQYDPPPPVTITPPVTLPDLRGR